LFISRPEWRQLVFNQENFWTVLIQRSWWESGQHSNLPSAFIDLYHLSFCFSTRAGLGRQGPSKVISFSFSFFYLSAGKWFHSKRPARGGQNKVNNYNTHALV
jgi:hypothetical protein